jgi:hypothetical protein
MTNRRLAAFLGGSAIGDERSPGGKILIVHFIVSLPKDKSAARDDKRLERPANSKSLHSAFRIRSGRDDSFVGMRAVKKPI